MSEMPTGIVTFLLTDIEGSMLLWEQNPEAMDRALARHNEIAASVIARHGGVIVKSQGEGDSLFCVFAEAPDAVAAACALQQAFVSEAWPAEATLLVRMALHTGEARLRDGDYYGPPANLCARLRSMGCGEQVLLSQATCEAGAGALPEEVSLKDLGLHRIPDYRKSERIFQALHPNLPWDFPPLGGRAAGYTQTQYAKNSRANRDWAFAQRGYGLIHLSHSGVVTILEFNEFLDRVSRGLIQPADMVVSGVFTDGRRKRAGELRVFRMVRSGALRTDDLPRRVPNGVLASGEVARALLRAFDVQPDLDMEALFDAVSSPTELPEAEVRALLTALLSNTEEASASGKTGGDDPTTS